MRIIICLGDRPRSGTFFTENFFFRKEYYTRRTVPRLTRSTKLSLVWRRQYLDGWINTNTPKYITCFSFLFFFFPLPFSSRYWSLQSSQHWGMSFLLHMYINSQWTVCYSFRPVHIYSTCIYLRLRISLIVACGIASERLALTAGFNWGSPGRWREKPGCFA